MNAREPKSEVESIANRPHTGNYTHQPTENSTPPPDVQTDPGRGIGEMGTESDDGTMPLRPSPPEVTPGRTNG